MKKNFLLVPKEKRTLTRSNSTFTQIADFTFMQKKLEPGIYNEIIIRYIKSYFRKNKCKKI